jgi:hypothetical protein
VLSPLNLSWLRMYHHTPPTVNLLQNLLKFAGPYISRQTGHLGLRHYCLNAQIVPLLLATHKSRLAIVRISNRPVRPIVLYAELPLRLPALEPGHNTFYRIRASHQVMMQFGLLVTHFSTSEGWTLPQQPFGDSH